jgi:hypothetical protein
MKYRLTLLTLLLATPAWAEEPMPPDTVYVMPQIPSEEAKIAALKLAYKINGNSMVGHNEMIDLTKPIPVNTVKIPTSEVIKSIETSKPVQKAEVTDTCTRHGMHKVIRGSSWRCKK